MNKVARITLYMTLLALLTAPVTADLIRGKGGMTVEAPRGWTKGKNIKGTNLVLYAPKKLPNFHPNINIMIQDNPGMTDAKFKSTTDAQVKEMGGRSWDYKSLMLPNDVSAKALNVEFPHQGMKLASLSVWFFKGGKTYLITGTTTAEDFKRRRSSFIKIAQTFKL